MNPDANLVAVAEREVIARAKLLLARHRADPYTTRPKRPYREAETMLLAATAALEEHERAAAKRGECCSECQRIGGGHYQGCVLLAPSNQQAHLIRSFLICDTCQERSNSGPGREAIVGDTCPIAGCLGHMREQTLDELAVSQADAALRTFYRHSVTIPPRRGAQPIPRKPKKLSRRDQEIEARRRSDPLGQGRDDIDYGDDSLPTAMRGDSADGK